MKIKKTVYDDRKDATELADCIKMTVNSKMNLLRRLSVNDAIDFHVLLMHLRLKPTLVVILINFSFQVDRPKLKNRIFLNSTEDSDEVYHNGVNYRSAAS